MEPIEVDNFYREGRGPELRRIHWDATGCQPTAIDYFNPDAVHDDEGIKHVLFRGMQVITITPEEVIGSEMLADPRGEGSPAAMFNLGKDPWFRQFSPQHLANCQHFQLVFYDELVDVICEGVECQSGPYTA